MLVVHFPDGKFVEGCGEDSRGIVIPYKKGETDTFPVFDIGTVMDEMGMEVGAADLFVGGLECPAEWYGLEPGGPGVAPGERCLVADGEGTALEVREVRRHDGYGFGVAEEAQTMALRYPTNLAVREQLPPELAGYQGLLFSSIDSTCHNFIAAIDSDDGLKSRILEVDLRTGTSIETVCANKVLDVSLRKGGLALIGGAPPMPVAECEVPLSRSVEFVDGLISEDGDDYATLMKTFPPTLNVGGRSCSSGSSSNVVWVGRHQDELSALTDKASSTPDGNGDCSANPIPNLFDVRTVAQTIFVAAGIDVFEAPSVDWLTSIIMSEPRITGLCSPCGPNELGAVAVTEFLGMVSILVRTDARNTTLKTLVSPEWHINQPLTAHLEQFRSGLLASADQKTIWVKPEWNPVR